MFEFSPAPKAIVKDCLTVEAVANRRMTVSAKQAETIVHARNGEIDSRRREAECAAAEQVDGLAELQHIAEASKGRKKGSGDA